VSIDNTAEHVQGHQAVTIAHHTAPTTNLGCDGHGGGVAHAVADDRVDVGGHRRQLRVAHHRRAGPLPGLLAGVQRGGVHDHAALGAGEVILGVLQAGLTHQALGLLLVYCKGGGNGGEGLRGRTARPDIALQCQAARSV